MAPWLLLGLFTGCSDYELVPDDSIRATPNPPDLTTPVKRDRIVQVTVPAVDVLWVIDNSCSMEDEQNALANNFAAFMGYFVGSGLDYHIGVVSTDYADINNSRGLLQQSQGYNYIDQATVNPTSVFSSMARLGISGATQEMGRSQVYATIGKREDPRNRGFYRDEASFAVVVISDEDDNSVGPQLNEFIPWLQNLKPHDDMVSFSSIVGNPGSSCGAQRGADYLTVTRAIRGIEWDICNQNWSQVLEQLGMQAAGLKREFFLTDVPVEGTIDVWAVDVDEQELGFQIGDDYVYSRSRNSIEFLSFVPDPLTEVFIEYEVLAGQVVDEDERSGSRD